MKTALMLATLLASFPAAASVAPVAGGRAVVHDRVEAALRLAPASGQVTVIVRLRTQADLGHFAPLPRASRRAGVVGALRAAADAGQADVRAQLRAWQRTGHASRVVPLWVVNGLSVTATPDVIRGLAARTDVAEISPDEIDVVPSTIPAGPPEGNVAAVGAPNLWSLGYTGEGIVIATLDSGVDVNHPDLAGRYRGGANSWFDPYGQSATPVDRTGHGTWTAGVLVGGDAGGTTIGVAPGATFIAARIWNDSGAATATAIHRAFQWLLDPDGNPATDDAPDVVNGSWSYGSPGCNLEFQADVRALRSAGIVPVFAAGNFGPGAQTGTSPANYPEALSVGSVTNLGAIAASSSRGPSACGGGTFPTVVAPGVSVLTSDLYGSWYSVSGTSIAAPHVSGLLALLLGAHPGTTGSQVEAALVQTAHDLGISGPDSDFGNGLVDGPGAHGALATAPPPPPTAAGDDFTVPGDKTSNVAAPGVLTNDTDPGGHPLTAVLSAGPLHGVLALGSAGGFTYTPTAGFAGTDAFTYVASNGTQQSAAATVTLTINSSSPTAAGDSYVIAENTTLSVAAPGVLANDSDPLGRPISAVLVGSPQNGTVSLGAAGGFTYTPRPGFYGADGFAYQATNGTTTSGPASVSLTVNFVNQPPVARDDAATTTRGVAVNVPVLVNDTDVDGSIAGGTVTITSAPRNGTASKKSNGTVTYTPKRTYRGTDTFKYTVKDNNGATSNAATVTVQVK